MNDNRWFFFTSCFPSLVFLHITSTDLHTTATRRVKEHIFTISKLRGKQTALFCIPKLTDTQDYLVLFYSTASPHIQTTHRHFNPELQTWWVVALLGFQMFFPLEPWPFSYLYILHLSYVHISGQSDIY